MLRRGGMGARRGEAAETREIKKGRSQAAFVMDSIYGSPSQTVARCTISTLVFALKNIFPNFAFKRYMRIYNGRKV